MNQIDRKATLESSLYIQILNWINQFNFRFIIYNMSQLGLCTATTSIHSSIYPTIVRPNPVTHSACQWLWLCESLWSDIDLRHDSTQCKCAVVNMSPNRNWIRRGRTRRQPICMVPSVRSVEAFCIVVVSMFVVRVLAHRSFLATNCCKLFRF